MPEADTSPRASPSKEQEQPSLASTVGAVCHAVERMDPGAVSELRRMNSGAPGGPAFWRIVHGFLEPRAALPTGGTRREDLEAAWIIILRAAAELRGFHAPAASLGRALGEWKYQEMRMVRLLRARGDQLAHEVRCMTHFLAQQAARVNVADIAWLVVTDATENGDARERVRRGLARDYYRAVASR